MVEQTFLVDHVLQDILSGLETVPVPIKHLLADHFCLLIMQSVKVRVGQALLDSVSLVGIESQHLGQQICCGGLDIGEELFPGLLGSLGQRLYILDGIVVS